MHGALRPKLGRNDRCPCESGKKYKKCCGQSGADARGSAKHFPGDAEAHFNRGNDLQRLGQLGDSVASYRRALELKIDFPEAHINLGNALLGIGQFDEAAASYRRALALRPDVALAHNNLGSALRRLGRLDEAAASYRRALQIKPGFVEAHNNLGNVLHDCGRLDDAVSSFRRALALNPDSAETHNNLGMALRRQGLAAEAEAACRAALTIDSNLAAALVFLADLHADKGRFAEAEDLFKRAIAIEPQSPMAWAGIAGLRKMTIEDAGWLAEAQRIAEQPLPPRQEVPLRYALGKYCDDTGDFDRAFLHYRRANELAKQFGSKYDRQSLAQAIDLIIRSYDHRWLSEARMHASGSPRPVFIVGMPRSGTTLAEQILAAHPAVFGGGELPFWNTASATYLSSMLRGEPSGSIISKVAGDYLRVLDGLSTVALRVVDKMPANFLFLGLMHAAFPNARIIHLRRHPIDTCLSIYFQHFEPTHPYANDLDDLAHYYTEYLRMMEHWRSTLPEEAILDVPYEGLVDGQEAWSRKMLDFIGLPWDPICNDFHLISRAVNTFSKWQVRQKIHRSSVERWRKYEKSVGPLLRLTESAKRSDVVVKL